jgi:PKD repeat protein
MKTIWLIRLLTLSSFLFSLQFLFPLSVKGANPSITNNLVNLSQGLLSAEYEDYVPEMIIEGNIVHTVWTTRVGNNEGYLFYCRSTDLGNTWETPKQIYQYKDGGKATDVTAQRLAVSGSNVYIGIADYDYSNNGTGFIYFVKSSDGGTSFGSVTELANSGGGFSALSGCFIRASGNNVALVYRDANYNNAMEGLYCLVSSDNGNTFVKTTFSEEYTNGITDMLMEGDQIIVVHEYAYYNYGLNTGRVFVSVSNENGASFTTNKVSVTYTDSYGEQEKCRCYHDARYVPKAAKDGNNIHLIFTGNNEEGTWTLLYARSTDSGHTFETAVDINNGKISNIQSGQESLVAKNGHVYIEYLSTSGKVYLVRSEDSGATLSEPQDLMTDNTNYIQTTWWPQLVIDPTDETGKTVYFGSGSMCSRKSINGGESFYNTTFLFPVLDADVRNSVLQIDNEGGIHWLSKARIKHYPNYDYDIFYGKKKIQPDPGTVNKAFHLETIRNEKRELAIVPSSPSIAFDSVMTGEAWIKMKPGSGLTQNIFAKINGYDGPFYESPGYHLIFDDYYGKRRLTCGVQTDKGEFINWSGTNVLDTLWHHVAFTYDANAGLNNLKLYIDGLLIVEQTVTGAIIPEDGLLMIGSRAASNADANYLIDDIRLWNRALTQEELIENQTKTFTGEEDSLKLWLNFDDTFKDISGNGNDAIPLYLGEMEDSGFDPPLTAFEMYQVANVVSFNNKTNNATSWLWDFDDDATSVQGNPQYTYETPGEYDILLISRNNTTVSSTLRHATIVGLDRVEPSEGGNFGSVSINLFGGGLNANSSFKLIMGSEEILADTMQLIRPGKLLGVFKLDGRTTGDWDVVMTIGNNDYTLEKAFKITEGDYKNPDIYVTGRSGVLVNMWYKQSVTVVNDGNIDLVNVPVFIAISNNPDIELEYINFKFITNSYWIENGLQAMVDTLQDTFVLEDFFSDMPGERVTPDVIILPIILNRVQAHSSETLHLRIKSKDTYEFKAWTIGIQNNNSLKSANDKVGDCMVSAAKWGVSNMWADAVNAVIGGAAGCVKSVGSIVFNIGWREHYEEQYTVTSFFKDATSILLNCGSQLPVFKAVRTTMEAAAIGFTIAGIVIDMADCMFMNNQTYKRINTLLSFDPNEMIGPSGFSDKNYIRKTSTIPYTVLFENKNEATAPAHLVTISDTLDLDIFDISNFGFGSFGWGDTILNPPDKNMKEFSMDVDMRPEINLITRISAKLDTVSGIINWEFISLNPETMNFEDDPVIGFLPPNNTSPEGEGFVSFSVGLKEDLSTNSEIRNKASIIFDANEPIITNEYLNTLDLIPPQSQVYPLESEIKSNFDVAWTGSDEGSGIMGYTIFVMENDTALYPWLINTDLVTDVFHGELGSNYKFYSIATDYVGHSEATPNDYDAQTTVTVDVEEFERMKEELAVWPNPVKDNLRVTFSNAPCGMYVVELVSATGSVKHSQLYEDRELQNGISVNVLDCPPGQYVLRVVFGNKVETRKVMVQ